MQFVLAKYRSLKSALGQSRFTRLMQLGSDSNDLGSQIALDGTDDDAATASR